MQYKDEQTWLKVREKSVSDNEKALLVFAERWADRMERGFKGTFNHEIAIQSVRDVPGFKDLTPSMRCDVVGLLAQVWIFGEELRQLHNILRCNNDLTLAIKANMDGSVIRP
jgi:hypothetical protein